jgi:protein SCO1/2
LKKSLDQKKLTIKSILSIFFVVTISTVAQANSSGGIPAENAYRSSNDRNTANHIGYGWLNEPLVIPAIRLMTTQQGPLSLESIIRGKPAVLSLMFSRCKTTCPIQGTRLSKALSLTSEDVVFLSISIDVGFESVKTMQKWRANYPVDKRWIVATPEKESELQLLQSAIGADIDSSDAHTNQIYILDRTGRLVFRTPDFPSPESIVDAVKKLF